MSAFTTQVGGGHYLVMKVQPFQLAYLVAGGDAAFCKVIKYITRVKGDRNINLQKAIHVVDMKQEVHNTSWGPSDYSLIDIALAYTFQDMEHGDKYIAIAKQMLEYDYDKVRQLLTELLEPVDG